MGYDYLESVRSRNHINVLEDGSITSVNFRPTFFLNKTQTLELIDFYKENIEALDNYLKIIDNLDYTDENIAIINNRRRKEADKEQQAYFDSLPPKITPKDDLYLFINTVTKHLKIGRSKNIKSRLKQLNMASPHKIETLFSIKEEGGIEEDVHFMFSKFRANSEWFEYSEDIISYFKELQIIKSTNE